jgi:hypothetical protein
VKCKNRFKAAEVVTKIRRNKRISYKWNEMYPSVKVELETINDV